MIIPRDRTTPLILDGAMGTELTRRGVPTDLPLWSATALLTHLEVVEAIHRDYAAAGADILVANTFRTNPRTLIRGGLERRGPELNRLAIAAARRAALFNPKSKIQIPELLVAASIAPVEDCYRPDLVPDEPTLDREHAQMVEWLIPAEPDLLWIETINTVREARAAARAAHAAGLEFAISFVTDEGANLLSGEPLSAAVDAVMPHSPLALGLNCIPPAGMTRNLPHLLRLAEPSRLPVAAYAHIGNPNPISGWTFSESTRPDEYAAHARHWLDLGAKILGGCCGTTPAHVAALAEIKTQK
jgi:S-methylmethionine-dependent homocysteine/selenocysteine methylase